MNLRTPARLATSGLLALSVAAGATAATTSTASAASGSVGRSACTESVDLYTDVSTTVKFRKGPGTKYVAKGQLSKRTKVYWDCNKGRTGSGKSWGYVKVLSGAHKGERGWVFRNYINTPMQLD
ncbi:hypothetical protein [Streptomyces sp. NBC_01304]|uniref:hypothetical protein n=1 Tax=Streptomyces sp. NBC_01304 TaxID=2903818 RepID=UPI002E1067F1|nr:hypothetical protein OG430_47915 [Streptomyces sp. NBC_01304]